MLSESSGKINMDAIMQASLGEVSNELTVNFKKTTLVREYETEVLEATSTVKFDYALVGIERMFVTAIVEIQMEYAAYCNLTAKGLVTQSKLIERKEALEEGLYAIKCKADQILGPGVIDKYINDTNLGN